MNLNIDLISWLSGRHSAGSGQMSQSVPTDTTQGGDDQCHTHQHHTAKPHHHH